MNVPMIYVPDSSRGVKFVRGFDSRWQWEKLGGHYDNGENFLWVQWTAYEKKPNYIDLHVDSPTEETDPILNKIKQSLVADLLSNRILRAIDRRSFVYKRGLHINLEAVRKNRCTTVFHVKLPDSLSMKSSEEKIKIVNELVPNEIDEVIDRYREELDRLFSK